MVANSSVERVLITKIEPPWMYSLFLTNEPQNPQGFLWRIFCEMWRWLIIKQLFISKMIELSGGTWSYQEEWIFDFAKTEVNLKQPQGLDECDLCVEFENFLSNFTKLVGTLFLGDGKILYSRYKILVVLFPQILLLLAIVFSSIFKFLSPAQNSTQIQAMYH